MFASPCRTTARRSFDAQFRKKLEEPRHVVPIGVHPDAAVSHVEERGVDVPVCVGGVAGGSFRRLCRIMIGEIMDTSLELVDSSAF